MLSSRSLEADATRELLTEERARYTARQHYLEYRFKCEGIWIAPIFIPDHWGIQLGVEATYSTEEG